MSYRRQARYELHQGLGGYSTFWWILLLVKGFNLMCECGGIAAINRITICHLIHLMVLIRIYGFRQRGNIFLAQRFLSTGTRGLIFLRVRLYIKDVTTWSLKVCLPLLIDGYWRGGDIKFPSSEFALSTLRLATWRSSWRVTGYNYFNYYTKPIWSLIFQRVNIFQVEIQAFFYLKSHFMYKKVPSRLSHQHIIRSFLFQSTHPGTRSKSSRGRYTRVQSKFNQKQF